MLFLLGPVSLDPDNNSGSCATMENTKSGSFARWGWKKRRQGDQCRNIEEETTDKVDLHDTSRSTGPKSQGRVLRTRKAPSPQYEMAIFLDNLEELPVPVVDSETNMGVNQVLSEGMFSYCTAYTAPRSEVDRAPLLSPCENAYKAHNTTSVGVGSRTEDKSRDAELAGEIHGNETDPGERSGNAHMSTEDNVETHTLKITRATHRRQSTAKSSTTFVDQSKEMPTANGIEKECVTVNKTSKYREKARRDNRRAKVRKKLRRQRWRVNQQSSRT